MIFHLLCGAVIHGIEVHVAYFAPAVVPGDEKVFVVSISVNVEVGVAMDDIVEFAAPVEGFGLASESFAGGPSFLRGGVESRRGSIYYHGRSRRVLGGCS